MAILEAGIHLFRSAFVSIREKIRSGVTLSRFPDFAILHIFQSEFTGEARNI